MMSHTDLLSTPKAKYVVTIIIRRSTWREKKPPVRSSLSLPFSSIMLFPCYLLYYKHTNNHKEKLYVWGQNLDWIQAVYWSFPSWHKLINMKEISERTSVMSWSQSETSCRHSMKLGFLFSEAIITVYAKRFCSVQSRLADLEAWD